MALNLNPNPNSRDREIIDNPAVAFKMKVEGCEGWHIMLRPHLNGTLRLYVNGRVEIFDGGTGGCLTNDVLSLSAKALEEYHNSD